MDKEFLALCEIVWAEAVSENKLPHRDQLTKQKFYTSARGRISMDKINKVGFLLIKQAICGVAVRASTSPQKHAEQKTQAATADDIVTKHRSIKQVRILESERRKLVEKISALESRAAFKETLLVPHAPFRIEPQRKDGAGEAVLNAIFSDWHVEEEVDRVKVNGLNEYNPDIAKARAEAAFKGLLHHAEIERSAVKVDTLCLGLLGDFITGWIHQDLQITNYKSPNEALLYVKNLLISGIDFLLEHGKFRQIIVPCTYGNHGRNNPKPLVNAAKEDNMEWMMYQLLAEHYASAKDRITFLIADGPHVFTDFGGFITRWHHGDYLSYAGGVGGLSIPLYKAVAQWNRAIRADMDAFGHWHNMKDFGFAVGNGSLIGYSPYGIKIKAEPELPPRQATWFIDLAKKQRACTRPIWLED